MDRQKSSSTVSVLSVWTLVRRSPAVGVIGRMVVWSHNQIVPVCRAGQRREKWMCITGLYCTVPTR